MEEQKYLYKCPEHSGNLNDMRLTNKWCDVTIRVNDREFPAHKVILAANLTYFKRMFSNDSFLESKEGVITMDTMEEEDLEAFICYAYTGELLLTENNALNFLEVANYLSESGVKEACVHFLNKNLKKQEACRAYRLATVLACPSLKDTAKAIINVNFENCSNNLDYLNFDIESLIDILSDGKVQPVKQQQTFFKGIIKWIMYKASNRKIHIDKLLSLIDILTLTPDFLIDYLPRNIDSNDEHGFVKDIIFRYHTRKIEQEKSEKPLLIEGVNVLDGNSNLLLQYYSFVNKKWTSLQEVSGTVDTINHWSSAILYGKVYFIKRNLSKWRLQVFDPATKEITELNSTSNIYKCAAICACSKSLYLCGGRDTGDNVTNKVLRYDPLANSFETLTPMETRRSSTMATICRGFLYILGGYDGSSWLNSVEKYDLHAKQWMAIASMRQPRYRSGVAFLDGKFYVCGGAINNVTTNSVEVYEPVQNSWQSVANMNKSRHTFVVIAHEGTLLSFGGDISSEKQSIEVYHPSEDQWQIDNEMSAGFQIKHPIGGSISSSGVFGTISMTTKIMPQDHVQKLKALGCEVDAINEEYCQRLMKIKKIWDENAEEFKDETIKRSEQEIFDEIKAITLKTIRLTKTTSLYDFVLLDTNNVTAYANNDMS